MAENAASTRLRSAIFIASIVCAPVQAATAQPDTSGSSSHVRSVVELTSFLILLNGYDRLAYPNAIENGKKVYNSSFTTAWDHIRKQRWVHDEDPFNVNQFGHPYQGATMYGLARASGHGFWSSLVYADVGSFAWEMAGETTPPSINDLITTGQAGSLLGEALYRMSDLVLKDNPGRKHFWYTFLADVISPPRAVNRRALGSQFRNEPADSAPATSWQVRLGATADALAHNYSAPGTLLNRDAIAEFSMSYGLPGKRGYDYSHPLDYFDFQASFLSNSRNPIENVMIRGLLKGTSTGESERSSGIWGLYGTYDYISPYLFRVSSTALSLGTAHQCWITPGLALQSSVLGGVGYGAAGTTTVVPSTATTEEIRDYHFGVTPQALVALRVIAGDRVMLDADAREYYVSGLGSDDVHGSETVFRGNAGAYLRIVGGHTLGVRFVASTRDAKYGRFPDRRFSEGAVTIAYSFLGANRFGAVKWQ